MNKLSGLFLESAKGEDGDEIVVQMPYSGNKAQMWKIDRMGDNPYAKFNFKVGGCVAEAMRVYELCDHFSFSLTRALYRLSCLLSFQVRQETAAKRPHT